MKNKFPKHITRLLSLLGLVVVIAFVAKTILTDPSFYKYGHYRADSVPELAAAEPLFKGTAYCRACHVEEQHDTSVGVHINVECEVCHGTSRGHPSDGKMQIPVNTIRLCSTCHEAMPARPARHPQIIVGEHPFPSEQPFQCHTCHNPHSPGNEMPDAETVTSGGQSGANTESSLQVPAAASKCAKCHGKLGQGRNKNPALAGMESAAFIEQMNQFKSGARESKKMARYAEQLSDEEIVQLAHYYEGLAVAVPE